MSLELTPNEYLSTSRDVYETAAAYQSARHRGAEAARDEERKRKERDAKTAASMERLRGR